MEVINSIYTKIDQSQNIAIIIPTPADVDAVVSAHLLYCFLSDQNKLITVVSQAKISYFVFKIIHDEQFLISNNWCESDLYIIVDCPTLRHTGFKDKVVHVPAEKLVLIDHHTSSDLSKKAGQVFSDDNWSSTGQGVFNLLSVKNKITAHNATLLLIAHLADTGFFQHNLSDLSLKYSAKLLSLGANLRLATDVYQQIKRPVEELKMWGSVLQNVKYIKDWDLLLADVSYQNLPDSDLDEQRVGGLIGFLASQNTASVVMVMIKQKDGSIRGFVRSNDKSRPAGRIAKLFGGDGFDRAGGFLIRK